MAPIFGFFEGGPDESAPPPPPPPQDLDDTFAECLLTDSDNVENVAPTTNESTPQSTLKGCSPKTRFRRLVKKQQNASSLVDLMKELRDPEVSPFVLEVEEDEAPSIKRVTYDSDSHLSVLLQMHGSVWGSVLPFCLVNVLVTYLVWLGKQNGYDVTCPISGHNFMAILVSFLIVTRSQITYSRFMEARGYLADVFRSCRELMHFTAVLTMQDSSRGAKQWRQDVAYRTILLLRVTIAALDYRSSQINTWEVIPEHTRDQLELYVGEENDHGVGSKLVRWAHGARTLSDENFRAPIVLAYNLRAEIMKQRTGDYLLREMHVNEELKILGFVSEYMAAFHGLKKLITTPFPFPLVQMARTFLFFWIFTLPFALVGSFHDPVDVMLIVFFTTYGFIGLEYVSMELDDPFGDDPNDFDDLGMAQMVFEDIYITLFKLDGSKSAEDLRAKVSARVRKGDALTNYRRDLSRDLSNPIPENVSAP